LQRNRIIRCDPFYYLSTTFLLLYLLLYLLLKDGQRLLLYSEELEVEGTILYSEEEKIWVAVIDWNAIKGVHPEFKS